VDFAYHLFLKILPNLFQIFARNLPDFFEDFLKHF